jgi:type IV fimbrial biogenesis protein FimT
MDIIQCPARPVRHAGLTLLELMITLVISAILTTLAVPAMRAVVLDNRMVTQVNHLITHLHLGRSEAVLRNLQVVMCKSPDGAACTNTAQWEEGWILFVDADENEQRAQNERILRTGNALPDGLALNYAGFGSAHYLTFKPSGITNVNGTFTLCDDRGGEYAKAVIVSKTGRPRAARRKATGDPLEC